MGHTVNDLHFLVINYRLLTSVSFISCVPRCTGLSLSRTENVAVFQYFLHIHTQNQAKKELVHSYKDTAFISNKPIEINPVIRTIGLC